MKALKTLSIIVLAAASGLVHLSAQAEEATEVVFTLSINESSPEANAFVPTNESMRELASLRPAQGPRNMFANPFLNVEWNTDISIELDDSELIRKTSIDI